MTVTFVYVLQSAQREFILAYDYCVNFININTLHWNLVVTRKTEEAIMSGVKCYKKMREVRVIISR